MKQKEKWANAFIGGNPDDDSRLLAQQEAWIDGFKTFRRKALYRAMADKKISGAYVDMLHNLGEKDE